MLSNVQKKRKLEKQKAKRKEKMGRAKTFLKSDCSQSYMSFEKQRAVSEFLHNVMKERDHIIQLIVFHSDNKEGLMRLYSSLSGCENDDERECALNFLNDWVKSFEPYGITHNSIVANISKTFSTLILFLKLFNDSIFCKTFSEENGFEVSELCKKKLDSSRLQMYESEVMDDIAKTISATMRYPGVQLDSNMVDVDFFNEIVIEKIVHKYSVLVTFIDKHVFNDYTDEEKAVIYADARNLIQTELNKLNALLGGVYSFKIVRELSIITLGL